jgi:hypothetical protein
LASIAVQAFSNFADEITFADATATTGDAIQNDNDDTLLLVNNTSGSSITVSATALASCDEGFKHDLSETVGAGKIAAVPMTKRITSDSTGKATVICTPATGVKIAAIRKV